MFKWKIYWPSEQALTLVFIGVSHSVFHNGLVADTSLSTSAFTNPRNWNLLSELPMLQM